MSDPSLIAQLQRWARDIPHYPALRDRGPDGQSWETLSWLAYWERVQALARGLLSLGLEPGDCVALVGDNRSAWVLSELAIMCCGGIPAPIYTTNTAEQVGFILEHSQCTIAIGDGEEQLQKLQTAQGLADTRLQHLLSFEEPSLKGAQSLASLIEAAGEEHRDLLQERIESLDPDRTALLIYTSGTTGTPKAVQLSHRAMTFMGEALVRHVGCFTQENYRVLSYLPLCHVAEQIFSCFVHLHLGGTVYFCPDLKQLKDYLPQVRPTAFLGVPRVWEKFEAAMEGRFAELTGLQAKLIAWARSVEAEAFQREQASGQPVTSLRRSLAHRLVLGKLKARLGLDELLLAATGAAPISARTQSFFAGLGLVIIEAYGMSETTGVLTASDPRRPVFGAVGKPLPGVEVKLAEDSEILARGPNVTQGYLRQPEATAELFNEGGWLQTGDLGAWTADGCLKIIGRKKDLIITAGGKNVAPAEIEAKLKRIEGVGQAVVIGDRQPYLTALIALDPEGLPGVRERLGLRGEMAEIAGSEELKRFLTERIEQDCNAGLASYQTIKYFQVMPEEFTVEGGELTPTMKLKRAVIQEKYASAIQGLYDSSARS